MTRQEQKTEAIARMQMLKLHKTLSVSSSKKTPLTFRKVPEYSIGLMRSKSNS